MKLLANMPKPQLLTCMKGYTKKQLTKDIVAGILVAVIAFPLSVALAISSGMSPEKGLYTAIIGGFIVSALGGSKVNIGGATAATVMTVFTIIADFGLTGLAIATVIAGILLVLMGLVKAGALLRYIPRTITLGFTAGIAMGIFSGQLKSFFGFEMGAIPVKVVDKFAAYAQVLDTIDITTLGIGLLAMAVLILLPKLTKKIPNSLAAILVTTPLVAFLDLDVPTIRSVYGELPSHFPIPELPKATWGLVIDVLPSAATLAILIAIVSLLACVVTDGLMGERHDSNQELIAEGIANIFCGIFGAVPVAGAVARASNSVKSGGRTPIAGIVHSLVVTVILLCMMPLAGYIPMPTLAAILILVSYNMSNWREFVFMFRNAPFSDIIVLMVTFISGVLVDLLFAVEIGVFLSAMLFLRRMSHVTTIRQWLDLCEDNPDPEHPEQLSYKKIPSKTLVYEVDGPMFFATVDDLISGIALEQGNKVVILRMRNVPAMDITAIRSMEGLVRLCRSKGVTLILSHVAKHPYSVMEKAGFIYMVGKENVQPNIDAALDWAEQVIRTEEEKEQNSDQEDNKDSSVEDQCRERFQYQLIIF